jgi:hypothetical protein
MPCPPDGNLPPSLRKCKRDELSSLTTESDSFIGAADVGVASSTPTLPVPGRSPVLPGMTTESMHQTTRPGNQVTPQIGSIFVLATEPLSGVGFCKGDRGMSQPSRWKMRDEVVQWEPGVPLNAAEWNTKIVPLADLVRQRREDGSFLKLTRTSVTPYNWSLPAIAACPIRDETCANCYALTRRFAAKLSITFRRGWPRWSSRWWSREALSRQTSRSRFPSIREDVERRNNFGLSGRFLSFNLRLRWASVTSSAGMVAGRRTLTSSKGRSEARPWRVR